jgi:hypothetical protein
MKLQNRLLKWFLYSLLAPLLGGWGAGCSVSRKVTTDKSVWQADSVALTRRDSLALSRSLQASVGQSVQLKHFTFSRPDSTGRQYVESATLLSALTNETYTEQSAAERTQTATLTETHAEQATQHTETKTPAKSFPYWSVAIAVAGIALACVYRSKY